MTLEERLRVLEEELARANRRARRVLLVACLVAGSTFFCAGPRAVREVRAGALILVDQFGRECAALSLVAGMPQLSLSDEQGRIRIHLGMKREGPGLALFDEQGRQRAVLAVSGDGSLLGLTGQQEETRAVLAVGNQEGPTAHLRDEQGRFVWHAP